MKPFNAGLISGLAASLVAAATATAIAQTQDPQPQQGGSRRQSGTVGPAQDAAPVIAPAASPALPVASQPLPPPVVTPAAPVVVEPTAAPPTAADRVETAPAPGLDRPSRPSRRATGQVTDSGEARERPAVRADRN